jgi:hypothetical protein
MATNALFDSILDDHQPDFTAFARTVSENLGSGEVEDGKLSLLQAESIFTSAEVTAAIKTELNNLTSFNVFRYLNHTMAQSIMGDRSKTKLPSFMFLKGKYDAKGKFDKLKARLVGGGHRQSEGSYGRTSSPTVDITHVLAVLALVFILNLTLATVDVSAAFLHADLKEEIYMFLPKDVIRFLNKHDSSFRDDHSNGRELVLVQLLKSLYGIKQASANWFDMITNWLVTQGFTATVIDSCVFIRGSATNKTLFIVLLHVDDLLLLSMDPDLIIAFRDNMKQSFGDITYHDRDISFLGMTIEILPTGHVFIAQPGYTDKICRAEGGTRTYRIPSTATLFSDLDETPPDPSTNAYNSTLFKSRLMSAMFLATRTRPDILKECTFLASFGISPGPKAFRKLARVYGYLRNTQNLGLMLRASTTTIKLYTDAAYAVHNNGRSHTGIVITFDGNDTGAIYCKSHIQKVVTLSSTEAELVAHVEGVKKALPLISLVKSLGIAPINNPPCKILCDNTSVLHIIANGEGFYGKSRHIEFDGTSPMRSSPMAQPALNMSPQN